MMQSYNFVYSFAYLKCGIFIIFSENSPSGQKALKVCFKKVKGKIRVTWQLVEIPFPVVPEIGIMAIGTDEHGIKVFVVAFAVNRNGQRADIEPFPVNFANRHVLYKFAAFFFYQGFNELYKLHPVFFKVVFHVSMGFFRENSPIRQIFSEGLKVFEHSECYFRKRSLVDRSH